MRTLALALTTLLTATLLACSSGPQTSIPLATPEPTTRAPTRTIAPTHTPGPDNLPYPAGAIGYAISWPQCGDSFPQAPFDFGIIGVTNGEAFTENPCFAEEYAWAKTGKYHPSIYMNLNYREGLGIEIHGSCGGAVSCQGYAYGWAAAQDAYSYAASLHSVAPVWWIDVQIVSDWSTDLPTNAQAVVGAKDYLESQQLRVGMSSTAFQWASVAGNAEHRLPVWDASALDAQQAADFCRDGKDFGGGKTEQIAYVDQFETVLACGKH